MLNLIALFPPYLIGFTVLFLLIPTVIACFARIQLDNYLKATTEKVRRLISGVSPGKVPSLVNKVQTRFETASNQLESINTSALIEGIYSEERFPFLSRSLSCEQWDNFTNILPNLLLAIGLLGTFFGITLNLTNISNILQQESANGGQMFQKLQTPLQSMGIAFLTSLIALGCSSLLTFINLRFNTNLSSNWLMSSLEDYLDNIFHPRVDGFTRLDKAINRMVDRQEDFLTRFHEKVGQVLESSLTPVANRIADENEKANRIATQVYQRFMESTGSFAASSSTFRDAVNSLESQVVKVQVFSNSLQLSCTKIESGSKIFQEASQQIKESNLTGKLDQTALLLSRIHSSLATSTDVLVKNIEQIINENKQTNELSRQVYTHFKQSAETLEKSSTSFWEAATKIESSPFTNELSTITADISVVQTKFRDSASLLSESVNSIASFISEFNESGKAITSLGNQIHDLTQKSTDLLESTKHELITENHRFNEIKGSLQELVDTNQKYSEDNKTDFRNFQEATSANITKCLDNNSNSLKLVSETIQSSVNRLDTISERANESLKLNQKHLATDSDRFDTFKDLTSKLIDLMQKYQQENQAGLRGLQDNAIANISQYLERNYTKLQLVSQTFEKSASSLDNMPSQIGSITDVIVRENSFNKEYLKSMSQALVSLNKLVEARF